MYEIYSLKERLMFLGLGILVVASTIYITNLYFEYRVINQQWEQTFTTPEEFWDIDKIRKKVE